MNTGPVDRDERTTAVEHASYRLAYLVLSYGLLVIVAYRSVARGESSWDLFALVIVGGLVSTGYQARQQVLGRRWAIVTLATLVVAGLLAAVLVLAKLR